MRQHRGDHNRLGVAVQICYLRFPGRVLAEGERTYPPLLGMVAVQLKLSSSIWDIYAERDQTRREHLQELIDWLRLSQFGRAHYRAVADWLLPIALQITQGMVLAQAVVDELRRRHIVLSPVATIERLCAEVSTRAQRQVYRLLTDPLSPQQRKALDSLLLPREGRRVSTLTWIRQSPGAPSAKAVLAHIERLQAIRAIALPNDLGRDVHQNRLIRLAREGAQTAVYQLEEYEPDRRHATLVAILLDTAATLIDETLDLHDRLIGSFFYESQTSARTGIRRRRQGDQRQGQTLRVHRRRIGRRKDVGYRSVCRNRSHHAVGSVCRDGEGRGEVGAYRGFRPSRAGWPTLSAAAPLCTGVSRHLRVQRGSNGADCFLFQSTRQLDRRPLFPSATGFANEWERGCRT